MNQLDPYKNELPTWIIESQHLQDPTFVTLEMGEYLFKQGEASTSAFVVLAGGLAVVRQEENEALIEIDKLFSGDIVGEMGLISGQERTASIRAIVPTKLLKIGADDFAALQAENGEIGNQLLSHGSDRWQRVQLSSILANLFGELDASTVHDLQNRLNWRNLSAGDVLCHQNEEADGMYIIISGRLRFDVVNGDGASETVGDAGPGETVGEYALITSRTRSATVMAVRDSTVVEITKTLYQELSRDYPNLVPAITRIIIERQQRAIGHLPSQIATPKMAVTIVPTEPHVDVEPFVQQLLTALTVHGKTRIIRSEDVDDALRRPGASTVEQDDPYNTVISQWFGKQEAEYDHLILIPDTTWSMWTARCISQTDRVLLIGETSTASQTVPSEIELALNNLQLIPRQDLVLWHAKETERPSGTLAWLTTRPQIKRHFHVRDQESGHFARLARLLLGKGIGLVFSGGGARGFVQLGVYKGMQELGIPIDTISGASFGSLMAAPIAQEKDADWVIDLAKQFANPKYTQDRTFPIVSLNKSEGLVTMAKSIFGDWQLEDSWIPCFVTVSNITKAVSETLETGPIWMACRKSIAIPGVFSPIVENGYVYVDGGIMNNFPIDITLDRVESDRVIAVSVSPLEGKPRQYDLGDSANGWSLLWNRINPFAKKKRVPTLAYSLLRTMEVNSLRLSREFVEQTDLFLAVSAKRYKFLDFAKYADIIKIGYDETFEQLSEWKSEQPDLV